MKWFNLNRRDRKEPPPRPDGQYLIDRSTATQKLLERWSKGPQKGLAEVNIEYSPHRQTRLCLVMCPEWDAGFPHYGIAKLAGVAKHAGFPTKAFDLNVEAFRDYDDGHGNWDVPFHPWHGTRDWHWEGQQYWEDLHKWVQPTLDSGIERIIKFKPDIIGFSLYYCNKGPTDYMIRHLKKRMPDLKVVIGGPQTHASHFVPESYYDYVCNGEGENTLLAILMQMEAKKRIEYTEKKNKSLIIRQDENVRFSLDKLPYPDYSDLPMNTYMIPNGALCAISRGCIAKCTFCEETHFYKYRQRTAVSTLDEVRYMYHTYGTDVFYFTDSLVNGNLNELRAFCEGVKAEGLKIFWSGYARCDGRMDREYFDLLRDGGCVALNYGTESGSQEVLDAMDKKVTIEEMEANFRDGAAAGIEAQTNWIVGYPNETPKMYEDSLTFLWRNRNNRLISVSQGAGFSVSVDSIVGQNFDKFGLAPLYYYNHWIKSDFTASIAHKLIKMKTFVIFTTQMSYIMESVCAMPLRPNLELKHYKLQYIDPTIVREMEYDYQDFDYDIIDHESPFAKSLMNEIWPFLKALWRGRGGYEIQLKFRPELELEEFGERNWAPLWANYHFYIDHYGNWEADFQFNYEQTHKDHVYPEDNASEPGPVWMISDFHDNSQVSSAAVRARKLAWRGDDSKKHRDPYKPWDEDKWNWKKQYYEDHKYLDFSFKKKWQGEGKWDLVS